MPYRWILFDADGTLFDYDRAEDYALRATFTEVEVPFQPHFSQVYHRYNAQVWVEFEEGRISSLALRSERFLRMFTALDLPLDPQVFSAAYLIHLSEAAFLLPGAEDLVECLRGSFHLAIITNGLAEVQRPRLAASPLRDAFELLAISEEIGAAKPHPAFFDAVFKQLGGAQRHEALVVGDSLSSDIQGGINYQLDTVWFNPQRKALPPALQPTWQIEQLDQLLPILGMNSGSNATHGS